MPSQAGLLTTDAYLTTVQWSRPAIGLKVFMSVAELGRDGLAEQIDHQARMGDRLRSKLIEAGWRIVNDTPLPLVCFTHDAIRDGRRTTSDILHALYARGNVWISDVVLGGEERVLRACITSFRTDEQDLDILINELEAVRHTR